ncbi:shikimate dehydrogenase [Nocardioides carbamazepini]|uniref:shikimate dehydrogenase n=1 Tax=Nocardioides carbamazepini TaxID=2854259 RepID=UPI00214A4538|nr:shikimate dehydrogenase [Nocardioides carbamazepini]MCR1783061.1 shikimate dehydrogenase [Nocardioides carbamazepini]
MVKAEPARCAVVGDPVAHSLSPTLHRAGYAALGIAAAYDAVRVPSGELAGFVAGLGPQWRGLSVTAPLKREALALADEVSEVARLAGGANTLVRTVDGWFADNTDVPGAVAAIRERFAGPSHLATILGGGATAASVGLALADLGIGRIVVAARNPDKATEAVEAIRRHPARPDVVVLPLDEVGGTGGVLVSTIPAAAQTPDLVARVQSVDVVFEVTYNEWPTPLVAAALRAGATVVSGLDLLVHQAVLQFGMFTGQDGPLDAMRSAGEAALASR